jgi:hypothetical protein
MRSWASHGYCSKWLFVKWAILEWRFEQGPGASGWGVTADRFQDFGDYRWQINH